MNSLGDREKEREIFLEQIHKSIELFKREKDTPLECSVKEEICRIIQSPIHRGNPSIVYLLDIFVKPRRKIEWILQSQIDLLEAVVILLKKVTLISPVLFFHVKEILNLITKKAKETENLQLRTSLLFFALRISNEIPDEEHCREVEREVIAELKNILKIDWLFTGVEGYTVKGFGVRNPVLVIDITTHLPEYLSKTVLDELEEKVEAGDRYFIFPKIERIRYNLTENQKQLLYLYSKHLLLLNTENTAEEAGAAARLLLIEGYSLDAALLYARSLKERDVTALSLIEYAITPEVPLKEKEHEIIWAHALTATASHAQAIPIFIKHHETQQLISSLMAAGKKEAARPLLEERIKKLKEEIVMQEIISGTKNIVSKNEQKSSSGNPIALLRIELASLLHEYGKMENSIEYLNEAFKLVKTIKHAKALCTRLILSGHPEEALNVLEECSFEVLDVDTLIITAVSLAQSQKHEEAEKLLKYGRLFNSKNEKIDTSLQNILMRQGKIEEALDILLEKIKTYTPNAARDCNALFTISNSFMMYKYAGEAVRYIYRKTGQIPQEWMSSLDKAAVTDHAAKEAFLSVAAEVKSLSLVESIRKLLEYSEGITPETEYYARKRLIEYCIHAKKYDQAHVHLKRMKSLSTEIDQNQDYLDTVFSFYTSQST